jgi:hypothetical protein
MDIDQSTEEVVTEEAPVKEATPQEEVKSDEAEDTSKLRVTGSVKEYSPADNANVLVVNYEIVDGNTVAPRSEAFPLGTDIEAIKGTLVKQLETYKLEKVQKVENDLRDQQEAETDKAIAELEGFSIE